MDITSTEVLNKFLEIEYKNGMFDKECNGVKIWQYTRNTVYRLLLQRLLGFSSCQTRISSPETNPEVLRTIRGWYEYRIRRNILLAQKREVLISSSPFRVEDGEGFYRDPHTSEIDNGLFLSHYILDRRQSPNSVVLNRSKNMLTYNTNGFDDLFRIKKEKKANKYQLEDYFLKPLEKEFDFEFTLQEKKEILNYSNSRVLYDESLTRYCRFLINKIEPRIVMFVCLPDLINQILCKVAKEEGIPSIEYQHGSIYEALPYCFHDNDKEKVECFPDYFFSYGDYEREISRMPIPVDHVIPVGSAEIDKMRGMLTDKVVDKEKKKILFISSFGIETAEIARDLSALIDSNKYEIVYKLHPKEIMTWESTMGLLFKGTEIRVIDSLESIHYHLFDADWVVGSASTALYEATCYDNIKIAYINNYVTIDNPLLVKKRAVPIHSANDLRDAIEEDGFEPNTDYKFFKNGCIKNINDELERIINNR